MVKDGKANFLIENNENNHNSCRVKVYSKGDAALLYESDVIPTGYYIEEATLFEDIPEGESEGYAIFEILDESSNVKSTLTVDLHFTAS